MPSIGDQHKASGHDTSPTVDADKPALSAYTAIEIATLQSRLDKQLGPEYISSRPGAAGQKVHYLAADKVINLANEVFGFNGWSSSIQNIQIDFIDENGTTGKISLGLSVIVRVTLKDGTFHEDVGYGHIENCKGKAAAFEKCKKEGTTDAMKRALRTFGNLLGNCIYDKEFVAKVTKVKVGAARWDVNELHRHPDFVPREVREEVKKIEYDDRALPDPTNLTVSSNDDLTDGIDMAGFDEADFSMSDPLGHPDEVVLPAESGPLRNDLGPAAPNGQMRHPVEHEMTTPSRPAQQRMATAPFGTTRQYPGTGAGPAIANARPPMQQHRPLQPPQHHQSNRPHLNTATAPRELAANLADTHSVSPGMTSQHFAPQAATTNEPPGFFSAKAAGANPSVAPRFNPHADSPSIRKTPGIDHRKSAPVKHELVKQPLPPGVQAPGPKDFVDPRANTARQLGAAQSPQAGRHTPGGFSGDGMSTSAYRPPTRRPDGPPNMAAGPSNMVAGIKRPPLNDVSNVQAQHNVTANTEEGSDVKRQRTVGPGPTGLDGAAQE